MVLHSCSSLRTKLFKSASMITALQATIYALWILESIDYRSSPHRTLVLARNCLPPRKVYSRVSLAASCDRPRCALDPSAADPSAWPLSTASGKALFSAAGRRSWGRALISSSTPTHGGSVVPVRSCSHVAPPVICKHAHSREDQSRVHQVDPAQLLIPPPSGPSSRRPARCARCVSHRPGEPSIIFGLSHYFGRIWLAPPACLITSLLPSRASILLC